MMTFTFLMHVDTSLKKRLVQCQRVSWPMYLLTMKYINRSTVLYRYTLQITHHLRGDYTFKGRLYV